MKFIFKDSDIKKIGKLLGVIPKRYRTNIRFELNPGDIKKKLALEIYPNIRIGKKRGNLISVYTPSSHLQLHFCTGYVISTMLQEITFIGEFDGRISGIIIEKEGGCSLYANVDLSILSGDFTRLGPEVMLSGISLSLTENVLKKTNEKKCKR